MMRKIVSIAILTLFAVSTLPFAVVGQAADPWLGTWKLDLSKSKYSPGPPPQSSSLTIVALADGAQKHTFDNVNSTGEKVHSERAAKFDGTDVPVTASGGPQDQTKITNAFRRIDDHSFEVVTKRDGKVTGTNRVVISSDGKTLTQTSTGTTPQGQPANNVSVWIKQ